MKKYILICSECKEKLFIFKEKPIEDVTCLSSNILIPYSNEIKQPIDDIDETICPFCKSNLIFTPKYTIEEEIYE
jgi:hypothetical protein